ncbi:MAG: tetratricopeptide repeat protein [Saprospiraceae bacterium]
MQNIKYLLVFLCCLTFLSACFQSKEQTSETSISAPSKLGEIDFQVTGNATAKPHFEKGLLLLHSFEYDDARAAFLAAQQEDSTFAMAYWGEAMTYNHSLWQRQEKEKAVTALNKLGKDQATRATFIKTELEQDFFQAIEVLYGEGTKYERDVAYNEFMEQLTFKYPKNNEIAAFYAISILGTSRNGRNEELYDKSARIAQGIIKENPNHPGALHYLIHSYDDPVHAHLAKKAADSYAKVAPDAAHALHMPSHIYVALGKWNDVVTSNIASWNASIKRMKTKALDNNARSYHAFNWLQYGFLQRGETEAADNILKDMTRYTTEEPSKVARGYLIAMKGAQMVETNTWDGATADIEIDAKDLSVAKRAGYAFLEGMKAYHQADANKLDEIINKMAKVRKSAMNIVGDKGFAMCSAGGYANKPPNQLDIDMIYIMEMELAAYLATLNGNTKLAAEIFEKASALDETLNYSFGPPTILKPVHEAYGEWLLTNNQAATALAVFEKSLKRHPRRLLSIKGKKEAATQLKRESIIAEANRELEVSMVKKDRTAIL